MQISTSTARTIALLKAMANESRLMILASLCEGEQSVGELEELVGLSQSALSQHLARLRRDGFVKTRRQAQTIFYSTDDHDVCELLRLLKTIYGGADVPWSMMTKQAKNIQ